jgi:MFS family permease
MISAFWRRWLLPFTILPLIPATLVNLFAGREAALLGCLLGLGFPMAAAWLMRRGQDGDAERAAIAMGLAVASVAWLGAGAGPVAALLLAAGAWGGTRLLYAGIVEAPAPPPAPEPPPPPAPRPLDDARARLQRIADTARHLAEPRLLPVATAISAVLDEFERRPERLEEARRFLGVNLDGLERIAARLSAGAEPPPGLPTLLRDMEAAATGLRSRLREEESAALAVQVNVLGAKIREAGYG